MFMLLYISEFWSVWFLSAEFVMCSPLTYIVFSTSKLLIKLLILYRMNIAQ